MNYCDLTGSDISGFSFVSSVKERLIRLGNFLFLCHETHYLNAMTGVKFRQNFVLPILRGHLDPSRNLCFEEKRFYFLPRHALSSRLKKNKTGLRPASRTGWEQ